MDYRAVIQVIVANFRAYVVLADSPCNWTESGLVVPSGPQSIGKMMGITISDKLKHVKLFTVGQGGLT